MTTSFVAKGRTAVVTGAGSGIGRALAIGLAREGLNVVVVGTNLERLQGTTEKVREAGVRSTAMVCDVSDRRAVKDMAERACAEYGAVHLLCNNAGVTTHGPFLDHKESDWDWVYGVVLMGVVHGVQAFYPRMVAQGGGQILNTHSQAGLVPDWRLFHGPYTSAKCGVLGLSVALRPEAAGHNVGVSVLIPAGTKSDIQLTERSRPSRFRNDSPPEGVIHPRTGVREPEGAALPPEQVAAMAIAGLKLDKPFIATHKGLKKIVVDYFDRILAAYDE